MRVYKAKIEHTEKWAGVQRLYAKYPELTDLNLQKADRALALTLEERHIKGIGPDARHEMLASLAEWVTMNELWDVIVPQGDGQ